MSGAQSPVREGWLGVDAVRDARERTRDLVRHTPVLTSRSLSDECGGTVLLKAENLQRTGSFKLRGALAKVDRPRPRRRAWSPAAPATTRSRSPTRPAPAGWRARCSCRRGVGAQGRRGARLRRDGAARRRLGRRLRARARERAAETGAVFVHPFDDPEIIAGQGTLGLELLEDVPELATVVVPARRRRADQRRRRAWSRRARPEVRVIGVQAEACAAYPASLAAASRSRSPARPTIADGIAIKRPGGLTLPLVATWVDEVVVVAEDDVAEAMVLLLERAKLVVEGAGAVGVAALPPARSRPRARGATVVVLSGGNVDAGLLAAVAQRHETQQGRRLRFFTRVDDRPGGLAQLLTLIAARGRQPRDGQRTCARPSPLHVRQTGVDLVLETRGDEHADEIVACSRRAGYEVERSPTPQAGARERRRDRRRQGRARPPRSPSCCAARASRSCRSTGSRSRCSRTSPTDVKVTVTASPRKGLDATLDARRAARARRLHRRAAPLGAAGARSRAPRGRRRAAAGGGRARAVRARPATRPSRASSTAPPTCSRRWARCATRSTRSASPATPRAIT